MDRSQIVTKNLKDAVEEYRSGNIDLRFLADKYRVSISSMAPHLSTNNQMVLEDKIEEITKEEFESDREEPDIKRFIGEKTMMILKSITNEKLKNTDACDLEKYAKTIKILSEAITPKTPEIMIDNSVGKTSNNQLNRYGHMFRDEI